MLSLFVQPTGAKHNLTPLPLPPQLQSEGESTEMFSVSVKPTGRTVSDGDLDVLVDLGEAVARAPTPMSRPKSRSISPVLPGFVSVVRDRPAIPPIASRQPGECDRSPYFLLCVYLVPICTP
jgi:hypothetical protein